VKGRACRGFRHTLDSPHRLRLKWRRTLRRPRDRRSPWAGRGYWRVAPLGCVWGRVPGRWCGARGRRCHARDDQDGPYRRRSGGRPGAILPRLGCIRGAGRLTSVPSGRLRTGLSGARFGRRRLQRRRFLRHCEARDPEKHPQRAYRSCPGHRLRVWLHASRAEIEPVHRVLSARAGSRHPFFCGYAVAGAAGWVGGCSLACLVLAGRIWRLPALTFAH
jgi:hypothetical protein